MASVHDGKKLSLKYLFRAKFADGVIIKQTPEDQSKDKENPFKSAFYDVLEHEKVSPVVSFELREAGVPSLVGDRIEVDLKTGVFKINFVEVNIADQNFEPQAPLKLIYFRETRLDTFVGNNTGETKGSDFYINRFFIGWETTYLNKKYQRTLAVNGR